MSNKSISDINCEDYESILNIPTHLVVNISFEGEILKSNISHSRILGWEPSDVQSTSLFHFIHADEHEMVKRKLASLSADKNGSITICTRCYQHDGSMRWISWTAIPKDKSIYAIGTDITKSVEIEKALIHKTTSQKEYQTRYTTFFEQSQLPMIIYSIQGTPLAANSAWEFLFGTTFNQISDYNILKDPMIKNTLLWGPLQRAYLGESVEVPAFLYDPKILNKLGPKSWIEAWISPVKDEFNMVREVTMILKDVTEKIETQKALVKSILERKASEEKIKIISDRLSMAVKAGHIGIWEWIPDTNYVYWDETTEYLYGYETGTFPRSSDALTERIYIDDRELVWSTIAKALNERKTYRVDHRIIRKDGSLRWVQESGMALYDDQGKPYHMMGTVMDITDRVEAEEDQKFLTMASELLNGSLNYKEILKTLGDHAINYFCDGVIIDQLLPEGDIKRLLVVHPNQEILIKLDQIHNDFPLRFENNPLVNALINGKAMLVEDVDQFVDQQQPQFDFPYAQAVRELNIKSSIRVRLKGRESILGVISFICMKNSEKNLSKRHMWLAEELAYRASMAFENALIHQSSQEAIRSRDEFLSIASHELKTPLQSLTLQNQMRKRNLDKKLNDAFTPEKVATMIEADLRHLMRINRLIDDMLDISRIRAGKLTFIKEKVEFCAFVKDVLERFRPQVESVGCYMTAVYSDPLDSHIDVYRVEQVIVNLLTNAMKYGAGSPIKIEVIKKQGKIQLHVHDQGTGIKEQDTERIFERFERAISSNEVSGLGLGLYISRQIMQHNEGDLFVRSVVGKGSTFIMELPCDTN
jgi:PAS domain S-box-containing protein